jgi:predicted regulator of Ras-like GTPase activity (Roadblock/LC7/MglB family)
MSEDVYANVLKIALTEVRSACSDITRSFIFAKDGTIIAQADQDAGRPIEDKIHFFQGLIEKADTMGIGGFDTFLVNGSKGTFQITRLNNMYLALSATKKADMASIDCMARAAVQTSIRLSDAIVSTPIKPTISPQDFEAENLTGIFVKETAQVDDKVLKEWSKNSNAKINEIEIETTSGKIARCKVKAISEREFTGKNLIRIPEKIYRILKVEKGELVKVKPITAEGK